MLKRTIISLFFIAICNAESFDLTTATPIRQGVHIEWYRTVCPGDDGSAIFVWSDTRFGMRNVFAHKISKDGNFLWGESGAVVTNLPGRQEDPVAIEDGNGGAFISWVDYRFDYAGDIFIQHINSSGEVLLDPNGIALAQQPGAQISINMATDSLGGVFVTWQDKRGGVDDDIYGTHVSFDHNIVAAGSGVPIVEIIGTQAAKSIEYAGNNEAFICWSDSRLGENIDIYGQRIDMSMNMLFAENGIPVANTDGLETRPRTTFVNNKTSLVTWKEGDENARILYQHVDENGLVFSQSKSVSSNDAIQTSPRVKRNNSGDVFIQWKDLRFDPVDGDMFMQKINSFGDALWADGVQVDPADGVNFSGRFASNNLGGFDIFWERGVYPNVDILFKRFGSSGSPLTNDPINVAVGYGYQFAPNIISGSGDSVFVVFADQSTGSIDLRVQYFQGNDPLMQNNGILAQKGLDGDIKYNNAFFNQNQDITLFWEDNRASKKIYSNRLSENTFSHFNGNQVSFSDNSSDEVSKPSVISTDYGAYLATFDASVTPKTIRINKISSSLENDWDNMGIALTPESDQRDAFLVDLKENGVGIFWSESSRESFIPTFDIFFQNVDIDGNKQFSEGGVSIVESDGDDYIQQVIPTPDGSLLIFWIEYAWPASTLKYNKISSDGNVAINWPPNGYSLTNPNSSSGSSKLKVKAISDTEGVFAVWNQDGNFSDIYAQKINWDGLAQWANYGVPVCIADNDQTSISFDIDSGGDLAFIAWEDYRNGMDYDIIGKELSLSSGVFSDQEIYFSSDTTNQQQPLVTAVAPGEFIIIWEDGRGYYNDDPLLINGVDLYGSAYISNSGITTGVNGIPIAVEYHDQKKAQMTNYNGADFLLHWVDLRSSGKEDLANYYAKTIRRSEILNVVNDKESLTVPANFEINSAFPNPFNGEIAFDFTVVSSGFIDFKIYDIAGRLVLDQLILNSYAGKNRVSWDGRNQFGELVSSGVYYYQFKLNQYISTGKITYLK